LRLRVSRCCAAKRIACVAEMRISRSASGGWKVRISQHVAGVPIVEVLDALCEAVFFQARDDFALWIADDDAVRGGTGITTRPAIDVGAVCRGSSGRGGFRVWCGVAKQAGTFGW